MKTPVIAIFDVGKTNKKLFLFNEQYKIVFERSARFTETVDEDGDPCENLESLRLSVFDSLHEVFRKAEFEVRAINFAAYGASLVYVDEDGRPLAPLYNYLKPYPEALQRKFYEDYGGAETVAFTTASPVLGSLNSGMQLYRTKYEHPELFDQIHYALHLPQYLSFLVSGRMYSDKTSIGCHTHLWDFTKNDYHEWVYREGIIDKLAPLARTDELYPASFPGNGYGVGVGLHDSSAALIPYLVSFYEPFVLISTGTWCISLNPFNHSPLTKAELEADCLCYMHYQGTPVKASRLFAGYEHEQQVKRIAEHFGQPSSRYRNMAYDRGLVDRLRKGGDPEPIGGKVSAFAQRKLSDYASFEEAYHRLIMDLVALQQVSTQLVIKGSRVKRIFVDGGFSKNALYMNLLADAFPEMEVFAASMAQATAIGAALAIHQSWNSKPIPNDLIELRFYARPDEKEKKENK
ncbi:FGGY-family carbohydrate kinase [Parapedobacter koreensis]|uniref:Sugar (Pentulose or hexulose) kinase n=1 Tax=Parapedobacter koreensis TaxID=332977 RepID=A0A1H7F7D2_9SPHI|nr:FGGY family carbohydrate kinase [Parapedobacter koreensis]SEK20232.1 Sugar (pentulose or hexulose) kinase [Parapedobacter koreensis]